MRQANDPSGRLRFGVFEVDLRAGELTKRGLRDQVAGAAVSSPGDAARKAGRAGNPGRVAQEDFGARRSSTSTTALTKPSTRFVKRWATQRRIRASSRPLPVAATGSSPMLPRSTRPLTGNQRPQPTASFRLPIPIVSNLLTRARHRSNRPASCLDRCRPRLGFGACGRAVLVSLLPEPTLTPRFAPSLCCHWRTCRAMRRRIISLMG